jgi:hypothetical protein
VRSAAWYLSFNDEIEPYKKRVDLKLKQMKEKAEDIDITLPERPYSLVYEPETRTYLFNSDRDYMTQLSVYKRQKNARQLSA